MLQGLVQLGGQATGYPGVADVYDRFEVVRNAAQVFFLFFTQFHRRNYRDSSFTYIDYLQN